MMTRRKGQCMCLLFYCNINIEHICYHRILLVRNGLADSGWVSKMGLFGFYILSVFSITKENEEWIKGERAVVTQLFQK